MDEVANDNGTVMGEVGGNSSSPSVLSAAIVSNLKKEFGKIGMSFKPELEEKLTKCINETVEENQLANTSSPTVDVATATPPISEQSDKTTLLPPLVFLFAKPGYESEWVTMGMMKNGKPEVIKNEEGSEITPAVAGFIDDKGFVYGSSLKGYPGPREVWGPYFSELPNQYVDLKELGGFILPGVFFIAFLIRKLKMTAEANCNGGGVCQVAILAVPVRINCVSRVRLKEAATLAGLKDVYLVSAEGLAAYYWFHEKEMKMEQNNYSKNLVVVDLFGDTIVYGKFFECDSDGKRIVVVKAILLFDRYIIGRDKDEFCAMVKEECELHPKNSVIPIIQTQECLSDVKRLEAEFSIKVAVLEDDESDQFKYFAVKGAALLSENPGIIGRQIRNMIGTFVWIEPWSLITRPYRVLPETTVRLTSNIENIRTKYAIGQTDFERRICIRHGLIGWLSIHGVAPGAEFEVTFELSWEGIWRVVGVSAVNPSVDDEGSKKAVKWDLTSDNEASFSNFGCSSYEECKSLLLKVAPSPSQAKFASTGQTEDGSSDESSNALDGAAVTSVSSGHPHGSQKKKRSTKPTVIRPNDLIVNTGLKKIKLESDWVEPVVKIEPDLMEEFGEGEKGQQVNLNEHEEAEFQVEEGEVKIEIIE